MPTNQVRRLVERIADAPFASGGWTNALEELASATGSMRAQLMGVGRDASIPFNMVTQAPVKGLEEFAAIDGASPDLNWRVRASIGVEPLRVVSERHYEIARRDMRCDIIDEFMDRYDMPFGCQATIIREPDMLVGLSVLRSRADGPSTPDAWRIIEEVAPHVRSAVKAAIALEQEGAKLVAASMETMAVAAFVCCEFGRVRAMTARAEDAMARGLPVRVVASCLKGLRACDDEPITRALFRAIGNGVGAGRPGTIVVNVHRAPALVSFLPLPPRCWAFGFTPRAVVIVRTAPRASGPDCAVLGALYGMTVAEAAVACALLAGDTRDEIAAGRGSSLATIQSQLKSVFRKAGVTREIELVNKLAWLTAEPGL